MGIALGHHPVDAFNGRDAGIGEPLNPFEILGRNVLQRL